MTEENLFKKVDQIYLYDDGIGYVQLYDASHANESEEQRIWTVSTLAGIAYGNEEAKNPEALYERLQTLKHESLWEFIRDGIPLQNDCIDTSSIHGSMRNLFDGHLDKYEYGYYEEHKENIACFRIKAPIFVARQFFRHRAFSYIEMSRRYTKDEKKSFEWFTDYDSEEANALVDKHHKDAYDLYLKLRSLGVHTQKASRILSQDVYTEWYVMGEVEGLRNFFKLRLDSHAQDEIRELASTMLELLREHQPILANKVEPQNEG